LQAVSGSSTDVSAFLTTSEVRDIADLKRYSAVGTASDGGSFREGFATFSVWFNSPLRR